MIALVVVSGVGAFNGLITVWLNVPSFVTTLATNFILFGLVLIWSNQTQATPIPLSSSTSTGHVSFASQAWGSGCGRRSSGWSRSRSSLHVLLTRTRFGVRIIATGGNLLGAAEAGVPVRRVKVWCFVLCSLHRRARRHRRRGQVREPRPRQLRRRLHPLRGRRLRDRRHRAHGWTRHGDRRVHRRDPDRRSRGRAHADRRQHERLLRLGRRRDHLRDGAERPVRPAHRALEGRHERPPRDPAPPAPASVDLALEVRGLTKRFGALVVLRGIDLELRQGEVLGLVGDNGAGKSTLVKILSGFYTAGRGRAAGRRRARPLPLGRRTPVRTGSRPSTRTSH